MKSKTRKRLIAFMLCMVLVLSGIISTFGYELQGTESQSQTGTAADTSTGGTVTDQSVAGSSDAQTATQPTQQLTYEDDSVKVTVDAVEEGNIPEGASLSVTPIVKKEITDTMSEEEKTQVQAMNDQYDQTEQKLQEKATDESYDIAGFLAYDITFTDADGNKLEPNGDVKVSMEYKEAEIPEAAKKVQEEKAEDRELDVTVMHLEEDEQGEVKEVVDMVADENKTATIETTETKEVEKAEFVTDSFSTFTLTWSSSYSYSSSSIDIKVVDSNGTEIGTDASYTISAATELSAIKNDIEGYTYSKATLNSADGTEVTYVKCERSGRKYTWKYSSDRSTWNNLDSNQICFVYTRNPGLYITDDIVNSGALKAEYISDDESLTVTSVEWFKGDNKDGTYEKVEKVQYEGDKSNLSDDGMNLYPAYDNGAQKWYKVEVTLSDADGTKMSAGPIQVAYYNELQNGSFEEPEGNEQWSNADYKNKGGVWQTTQGKIEIVNPRLNPKGWKDYSWKESDWQDWQKALVDGEQFAELNGNDAGALYQDVLTMEGTSLNYWLSHRARGFYNGSGGHPDIEQFDTMFLVIMPTYVAEDNDLTTQVNLNNYLTSLGVNYDENYSAVESELVYNNIDTGVMVLRVTSSNQAWQNITEMSGYTPTSSLTRFFFMSGKTSGSTDPEKPTVGNFLDKVGFSQSLPPVADDEFSLQIEKKFSGLTTEQITQVKGQISFEITAKKGDTELNEEQVEDLFGKNTISGSEMTSQPDGSLVYYITNKKIGVNDEYEVTIKEKDADLDKYQLETTAKTQVTSDGGDSTTTDNSTFTLKGKTTSVVTFTNTYKPANSKTVNFTKVWDDDNNGFNTRPTSLDVTLQASIVVEENGVEVEKTPDKYDELSQALEDVTLTQTLNAANKWNCSWDVPVYCNYKGTDIKINYSVKEGTINSDYEYKAVTNTDGTALEGTGDGYTLTDFRGVTTGESTTTSDTSTDNTSQLKAKSKSLTTSLFASSMLTNSASLLMSMDDLADATAAEESSLGEPAHNKYITYNASTADYTLNLDVKGAKGDATGVDVLFVIDTSGSMGTGYNNLLPGLKSLLTEDNGIVDQIFATKGNVNSVAFVSFAGKEETQTTSWYQTSGKDDFKQKINALRATGGTNWTYAMMKASDVLSQRSSSSNEKVVIFLSDGEPTFTINSSGRQTGYGYKTESSYYTDAINKVKISSVLSDAKMYSVYLTSDTMSGMKTFSDGTNSVLNKTYSDLVDGTDLQTALSAILRKVIPTYKDVVITDTLSDYVDFVESTPTITVTKKSALGATTTLAESDYKKTVSGKTVTVELLNGNSLEDGATYTVSFRVKPSETATSYYNEHGSYPHTGDAGTGTTSAGQAGFFSNNNDTTNLTYQIDGTTGTNTATYPKPVVQVTTHKLSYEKVWNKPDDVKIPKDAATINLLVTYTDGTTNTIQLTAANKYKYEENVSANKSIQAVSEQTTVDGYTPSYSITENGTKAVVTNSYTKITATSIKVEKSWEGDGPRSAVKVSLYQRAKSVDGEETTQYGDIVTLDENCNWQYEWEDLPQSEGNGSSEVTYTYAVREESIPTNYTSSITYAYDSTQTVATITNTYDSNCADEDYYIANVLQTEQWTINKIWEDTIDSTNRPDDLVVTVDGMNFTLEPTDKWTKTVTVLKKKRRTDTASENLTEKDRQYYEQKGNAEVIETSSGKSITFTNQLKTKSIIVHKVWNDGNIESRPKGIQFELRYRKAGSSDKFVAYDVEHEGGIYILTKENIGTDGNSWTIEINNLPAIYEFDVVEVSDTTTKYLTDVSHSEDRNTFTITNTLKWSAKKVSESWNSENEENKGLSGAEFELIQGENVLATGTSSTDKGAKGEIKWERTDYAKNNNINLDKLNGDYNIRETKAPSGYILCSQDWSVTFVNGLLTKLGGKEVKGTATDGVVIELTNRKVYDLPSTGGSGIYWYMIGGILLMFAAVWILYKNECREVLKR